MERHRKTYGGENMMRLVGHSGTQAPAPQSFRQPPLLGSRVEEGMRALGRDAALDFAEFLFEPIQMGLDRLLLCDAGC